MISKILASSIFLPLTVTSEMFFQAKTVLIPKDDKKYRKGEDDAFASQKLLVLADGVGGWFTKMGIDSGIFTRDLVTGIGK
jgi:hypothetical protein